MEGSVREGQMMTATKSTETRISALVMEQADLGRIGCTKLDEGGAKM